MFIIDFVCVSRLVRTRLTSGMELNLVARGVEEKTMIAAIHGKVVHVNHSSDSRHII